MTQDKLSPKYSGRFTGLEQGIDGRRLATTGGTGDQDVDLGLLEQRHFFEEGIALVLTQAGFGFDAADHVIKDVRLFLGHD